MNERYAIVAALLVPAALRPRAGPAGAIPLLVTAALALAISLHSGVRIHQFGAEAGGFDALLAKAPPARRLQAVVREPTSAVAKFMPYHHFAALYRARFGGVAEYSFADLPQSPVRYRPEAAPPAKPSGWEWDQTFRNDVDGPYFDYLLWGGQADAFAPGDTGPRWRLVGADGRWSLFEKVAQP